MSDTVLTQVDERGVAWLTLNRPDKHNAFDDSIIANLNQALDALASDPNVRLLVLNSNGKNFSAGADLNWMRSMADSDYQQNLNDAGELASLMKQLDLFPKPTLCLVQGAAFGGAVGLVSCCDIVLAEPTSSFCLSEVKIGLIPAVISPYVTRAMGERAMRRYAITAERFSADAALRMGLIHEVVDDASMQERADTLINHMLQNGPQAMIASKALVKAVSYSQITDEVIADTARRIAEIRVSQEGQEGLSAFLNKRQASWVKD